ncbi:hypothetical protein CL614_06220 [archaeon]|nr:hypothetical protein [archaeon]
MENKSFLMAKDWLVNSGIQNISLDTRTNGGFNSWYNLDEKKYPYIYSEITGYGITTLLYLYKQTKEEILLDRAKIAADWLINVAMHKSGGVKTRDYLEDTHEAGMYSFDSEILYSFDIGMVLFGLINLYKVTEIEAYLDNAKKIADFLLTMQRPDGMFFASYDAKTGKMNDTLGKWSSQSGSYHCKNAMGMIDLHEVTGDKKYLDSAVAVCDAALKMQEEDGRFVSFRDTGGTHVHPHSYTAEGLIYVGVKTHNKMYMQAAAKAVEWTLMQQLETGGVPSLYVDSKPNINERVDTLAQTLRLGVLVTQYGCMIDDHVIERMAKLKDRLLSLQHLEEGSHKGGFYFGFEDGNKMNHVNSWCSMFALQALDMYDKFFNNNQNVFIDLLV